MNEIMAQIEELSLDDMTYLFEWFVDTLNEKKSKSLPQLGKVRMGSYPARARKKKG